MKTDVVIAVTMGLLLEERASVMQEEYVHSDYYDPMVPVRADAARLQELARNFNSRKRVPRHRTPDIYALFCRVCQSYRLMGWEWEPEFFA